MNVGNNQRYQDTEERIFQAYWKLASGKELHKITVADLCREAKIHRTTFYGHFPDIYDLQEKVMKKQFRTFLHGFINEAGEWEFREGMRKQMEFYYRNRKVIKLHLKSLEQRECKKPLFEITMTSKMVQSYQKLFQLKNEREAAYHQEFFQTGLAAVVRQWVEDDCKEPLEEITDLMCRIFGM